MDFDRLIRLSIEMEGLLRVLAAREDATARLLLAEKYAEFSATMEGEGDSAPAPDVQTADQAEETLSVEVQVKSEDAEEKAPKGEAEETAPALKGEAEETASAPKEKTTEEEETDEIPGDAPAAVMPMGDVTPMCINDYARRRIDKMLTFSINDKFRYIREVFSGNSQAFEEAVERISDYDSLDQAYDFILNDLQLDPENDACGEFIALVANHFNSGQ